MLSLDLSFYNWELFTNYILKGLLFSIQLTVFATVGGIVFGTFLALMRLSGKPALVYPSTFYVNTMRSIPLVMVILWFFLLIPMNVAAIVAGGHVRTGIEDSLYFDYCKELPAHSGPAALGIQAR